MRPALRVLDRAGVEMGRLGITGGLGLADRITEEFAPVLRGALTAARGLRLRGIDDGDAAAFRSFLDANDVPAITGTFDPFPMAASSADRILAERKQDLYYGAFDLDGSMVAMSMLRGWDEGYEVPSFGIVVGHGHQGRGLGSRLTAWTVEQARVKGAPAVRLTVYDDNPAARTIYQRLGFAEVERRPAGARQQIVMKLELGLA
jgi:GNAT superfamily N-acetyltransferase